MYWWEIKCRENIRGNIFYIYYPYVDEKTLECPTDPYQLFFKDMAGKYEDDCGYFDYLGCKLIVSYVEEAKNKE